MPTHRKLNIRHKSLNIMSTALLSLLCQHVRRKLVRCQCVVTASRRKKNLVHLLLLHVIKVTEPLIHTNWIEVQEKQN